MLHAVFSVVTSSRHYCTECELISSLTILCFANSRRWLVRSPLKVILLQRMQHWSWIYSVSLLFSNLPPITYSHSYILISFLSIYTSDRCDDCGYDERGRGRVRPVPISICLHGLRKIVSLEPDASQVNETIIIKLSSHECRWNRFLLQKRQGWFEMYVRRTWSQRVKFCTDVCIVNENSSVYLMAVVCACPWRCMGLIR